MGLRGYLANLRLELLDCGKMKVRNLLSIEDCSKSFQRMGCPFARHCARYLFLAHLLSSSIISTKNRKILKPNIHIIFLFVGFTVEGLPLPLCYALLFLQFSS